MGVTYWASLLDKLHEGDPESARAVKENSVRWSDGVAHVGDRTTTHHGDEGFGIGRRQLLDLLAERARSLGVRVEYENEIADGDRLPDADLVVACDGVHSGVRERHTDHFGPEVGLGRNKYIWLGTTKVFDAFTFAFVDTPHGWIWCYAYGFSGDHSTCVVECSPETWTGLGLDRADETEGLVRLQELFVKLLDGHRLIGRANTGGSAQWLNFRTLTNRAWSHGNVVLLGDAAHTTHYSIGAGTTLALEDAIALAHSLRTEPELAPPSWRTRRSAKRSCCPCRARPGTAPSGTRACRATSVCLRRRCSRSWASGTPAAAVRPSTALLPDRPGGRTARSAAQTQAVAGPEGRADPACQAGLTPRQQPTPLARMAVLLTRREMRERAESWTVTGATPPSLLPPPSPSPVVNSSRRRAPPVPSPP